MEIEDIIESKADIATQVYLSNLASSYMKEELEMTDKEELLLKLIFKGRQSQMASSRCLGEALDIIKRASNIEEEILLWQ